MALDLLLGYNPLWLRVGLEVRTAKKKKKKNGKKLRLQLKLFSTKHELVI